MPVNRSWLAYFFTDNRLLFSQTVLTPTEVVLYDDALSGDYVVVASPFQDGMGANVYSSAPQFGIVAGSENQDAAWQFVRRFFTKQYQTFQKIYYLWVRTALEYR